MEFHRLDFVEQGIESFEGLSDRAEEHFLVINLQRNKLTNFEDFGTHPYLSELHLQHNRIQSFRGLTKQTSLRTLCLQGCPIAAHPYYRLMALLTIGLCIEVIDGLPITSQERHIAKSLGKRAALAVSYGWLLDLHPRTADDYDGLISEYKRLRRDERQRMQGQRRVSVAMALEDLSKGQQSCGYDATAEQQLEEQQRTITRLARRVALLEGQVAASTEGHVIPMLPPNQPEVTFFDGTLSTSGGLFSAAELSQVDTVSFTRGIQLRHNLSTTQGGLQRVCLQLDHTTLTAQTFLSRGTLVQLPLQALRVRHLKPLTLVVEDDVGGALELLFDTLPLLHTVYKSLFMLSSRPIPPLSAMTQQQLQEIACAAEMRPKPAASIAFSMASGAEPSAPRAASCLEGEPLLKVAAAKATAGSKDSGSASRKPNKNATSSPASGQLDNVEDVPPLPAAFSRLGTDSIAFSVEEGQRSTASEDAAARPSTVVRSNSNIEFISAEPSNKESADANAEATKPTEPPTPTPNPKSKLFANLTVNSSTSSDSVVFQTDGARSDGEDSVAMEEEAKAQATLPPPVAPKKAAAPSLPPSKVPLMPQPGLAVPPRPPARKIQTNTPAVSVPASATRRSVSGVNTPVAVPPPPARGPPSARSLEKSSLNLSAVLRDSKSLHGVGESSIRFRVVDAASEGGAGRGSFEREKLSRESNVSATVASPATTAAAEAARPRVPSRFGALKVDSDSD
jgi:hypothetical protein